MATNRLATLLPDWHLLLQEWASDGRLSTAAQKALLLEGEPELLKELVSHWAAGDFSSLPPIELLPGSSMPGAAGAYAISTNTIYINKDWLHGASHTMVMSVLTEELGHHLDGLLNSIDTPGDEGYIFASLAMGLEATRSSYARTSDIESQISIDGAWHNAELSSIPYYLLASTSHDTINTTRIWGLDPTVNLNKDAYVLIHGWRGLGNFLGYSDPSEIGIVKALVEGQSLFPHASQRFVVDWGEAAVEPAPIEGGLPVNAAGNILPIANWVAGFLSSISGQITIIGHSLGAIMAGEISRLLGNNANVVSLDVAWDADKYDLDITFLELDLSPERASPLAAVSQNALSLVVSDADPLQGFAGDNPYSATADVSLLINYETSISLFAPHTEVQYVYRDLLKRLPIDSDFYSSIFLDGYDPFLLRFTEDSFDNSGNLDSAGQHEGVIYARRDS